ncbi:MAG TPA: hypothetical protein VK150_05050, partial [Geothrix sp.]|nr:hypothetical protein [Geothrix sp.]
MSFRDECGVFGICRQEEASRQTYLGLYALQHRGQEAAGICSGDGTGLHLHKALGYVADVFTESVLDSLPGDAAIGHTRYSTTGGNVASAAHPFLIHGRFGQVALCHNGNLTNTEELRARLIADGHTFTSPSDSEVLLALINRAQADTLEDAVVAALREAQGAYSLLILTDDALIAARDPHGFRPLALGRMGETTAFSSETCAFDLVGAHYERDVEPGEMVVVPREGGPVQSRFPLPRV